MATTDDKLDMLAQGVNLIHERLDEMARSQIELAEGTRLLAEALQEICDSDEEANANADAALERQRWLKAHHAARERRARERKGGRR